MKNIPEMIVKEPEQNTQTVNNYVESFGAGGVDIMGTKKREHVEKLMNQD